MVIALLIALVVSQYISQWNLGRASEVIFSLPLVLIAAFGYRLFAMVPYLAAILAIVLVAIAVVYLRPHPPPFPYVPHALSTTHHRTLRVWFALAWSSIMVNALAAVAVL